MSSNLAEYNLTECQVRALELLESDNNVFLTGVAGSGKSFLLQYYLKDKSSKYYPIVASTGAAAVLVKGVTFHSFFSLGIMEGGLEKTIARAMKDKRLKKRLNRIQALVIDEVSMISGQTLEAAETICRKVRESDQAWGGIKVIAVGDFGQLPPVSAWGQGKDWAFLSSTWDQSHFHVAYLRTVVRSQDPEFLEVLNYIRNGRVNDMVTRFLDSKVRNLGMKFAGTRLFPHRKSVEDYNLKQLELLPGKTFTIKTRYAGSEKYFDQIKKSAPIPETLFLKVGALIMIRKNDVNMLYVNGSLGTVKSVEDDVLKVELLNGNLISLGLESFSYLNGEGEEVAAAENFPVNLAWASTIHKSQGMTLDVAAIDLAKVFEAGQAYVALSRVRSSEGLYLSSWRPEAIRASKEVQAFHSQILGDLDFV